MKKQIFITTEFINLGALLKYLGIIQQGSEAANFLIRHPVTVNSVQETRRGRKIYPGDSVAIDGEVYLVIKKD